MRKLTTEEFIKRAKIVHQNEDFDYSLVNYTGARDKVSIKCNTCGTIFKTVPHHFLDGCGCKNCTRIGLTSTSEEFIKKSKAKFGNKYDYSKVKYKDSKTKVLLTCNIHNNTFSTTPNSHLASPLGGCILCARIKTEAAIRLTKEEFIKRSITVHGNKYNYDQVEYINNSTKVKIYCNNCKEYFYQKPQHHLGGCGCSCSGRLSQEEFIAKAQKVHGKKRYDYSKSNYQGGKNKIYITCNRCGNGFWTYPNGHISNKRGCPVCNASHGEDRIRTILTDNNIKFKAEKTFINCRNEKLLRFDFYLTDYNLAIEFDGEQHFKARPFFGGEKQLNKTRYNDLIKTNYCYNNDIVLLRIRYDEDIYDKLNEYLELKEGE